MASSYAGPASLATAGNAGFTGLWHSGGVVGKDFPTSFKKVNPTIFYNAPRLHEGLAADEFPAILQRGETVTPKGESAGGDNYNILITAVDAQSFMELTRRNPEAIIGPFIDQVNSNNMALRSAIKVAGR